MRRIYRATRSLVVTGFAVALLVACRRPAGAAMQAVSEDFVGWFGEVIRADISTDPATQETTIRDSISSEQQYQLTLKDYKCKVWPQERLDAVRARLPAGLMVGWSGALEVEAMQAMAGLPDSYLDYYAAVYKSNGFKIIAANPGFNGGVTRRTSQFPIEVKILPTTQITWYTLQHELGHAIEMHFRNSIGPSKGGDFWRELSQSANKNVNNPQLNAYPKSYFDRDRETYFAEYWAEAFNSYYCSEETNSLLQQQFTDTYNLMLKYAEPPVWAANGGGGANTNNAQSGNSNGSSQNGAGSERPGPVPTVGPMPQTLPTLAPVEPNPARSAWDAIPIGVLRF